MKRWYSSSSGRIKLKLDADDAASGSHPGPCDADIEALLELPYIAEQFAVIAPELIREELRGFGAWDETELADDAQNLARLLWIACGDVCDEVQS